MRSSSAPACVARVIVKSPQLVCTSAVHVLAGSSASVGFGRFCSPFGLGSVTVVHPFVGFAAAVVGVAVVAAAVDASVAAVRRRSRTRNRSRRPRGRRSRRRARAGQAVVSRPATIIVCGDTRSAPARLRPRPARPRRLRMGRGHAHARAPSRRSRPCGPPGRGSRSSPTTPARRARSSSASCGGWGSGPPSRRWSRSAVASSTSSPSAVSGLATAFVIGSEAMHRHVADAGLRIVNRTDLATRADVVVVAAHDRFDYDELRSATQAVLRGAELIGAGRDRTFPMSDGMWPGTGAVLAAVETATGRHGDDGRQARAAALPHGAGPPRRRARARGRRPARRRPGRRRRGGPRRGGRAHRSDLARGGDRRTRAPPRGDRREPRRPRPGGLSPGRGRPHRPGDPDTVTPAMARIVSLIVNPAAGGGRAAEVQPRVERALADLGTTFHSTRTRDLEHARALARTAAAAGEVAATLGGDGLVGAVAGELEQTGGVLGILPGGRGNDLARVLGIPADPEAACRILAAGADRAMDVGSVDGRWFVGIASAGFDSDANRIANESDAHPRQRRLRLRRAARAGRLDARAVRPRSSTAASDCPTRATASCARTPRPTAAGCSSRPAPSSTTGCSTS